MNRFIAVFVFVLSVLFAKSQISEPSLITNLAAEVDETSGLLLHHNELWTHNDSGGDAKLFSIDTTNGNVIRSVSILNSQNIDWEDLCKDKTHAYIGDFGNNSGTRQDLRIYKIKLTDLENPNIESIDSEIIDFAYNPAIYDAVFSKRNTTNFDCEAMIAYHDSLYLFSKNWSDNKTYLYALSKNPGTYTISPKDTLNSASLICGADFDQHSNTIALIGYVKGIPAPSVIILLNNFNDDNFFEGNMLRKELSLNGCQTEGVVFVKSNRLWISNEDFLTYNQGLYEILYNYQIINQNEESKYTCDIYPNPAEDNLTIKFWCDKNKCKAQLEIYNNSGKNVYEKKIAISPNSTKEIDISKLKPGNYIIKVFDKNLLFQTSFIKI
ncbi:MAG: T9SS type A sorting domain-containing protein [Bacteroidales bacterium]|nr:T9SS type A sorting domain-containing protein [Bacteroidales bacterium]